MTKINKKMRVLTVVGTRPEIIRLSRVMPALDKNFDHIIAHTGQNYNYELNEIFFQELELRKPDYYLDAAADSSAETIGNVITLIDKLLAKVKPDAFLILGDTNSCLSAIPAKRRKIPIFHMEAGNRCFDFRVPEEINRRIVDHIADVNLTYSSIARQYLINEGIPPDLIITTGSPMKEVLDFYSAKINASNVLKKLSLRKEHYFLFSAHREENIDSDINFSKLVSTVNAIAEKFLMPVIISTHPRTQKKIDQQKIQFHKLVSILKPFGFIDYNKLQQSAKVVLSDSGTISEESSILNFPALNIREAHERPESFEEASVMMVGLDKNRILQAVEVLSHQSRGKKRLLRVVRDYDVPNVSEKIVRIIISYTNYVHNVVWKNNH